MRLLRLKPTFIPENCGKMMADVCVHMVFFFNTQCGNQRVDQGRKYGNEGRTSFTTWRICSSFHNQTLQCLTCVNVSIQLMERWGDKWHVNFNYFQKFIARGWQGKLLNLKAGGNATLHQNFNIRRIVVVLLAQFSGMPGAHWASFRFYPLVYPCSRLHRRTYSNSDLVTLVSIRIERSSHVRHVMHFFFSCITWFCGGKGPPETPKSIRQRNGNTIQNRTKKTEC